MKIIKIVSISAFLLAALTAGMYFFTKDKTAYVEMAELYNTFEMTHQMEDKYKDVMKQRQGVLDSLKNELQLMVAVKMNAEQEQVFVTKREQFLTQTEQFKEENAVINEEYVAKIWERLNSYIKKYGKEKGYDYVYGTNGQGNLLFANESRNITKDLAEYVNNIYSGDQGK